MATAQDSKGTEETKMSTLVLPLKEKWFDLIASGVKTEEYREINEYWTKRLAENHTIKRTHIIPGRLKTFDKLVFTKVYPAATDESRRIEFKNAKIRIDFGHVEWGAQIRKIYFVITWENNERKR